jgi:hypothetical protein
MHERCVGAHTIGCHGHLCFYRFINTGGSRDTHGTHGHTDMHETDNTRITQTNLTTILQTHQRTRTTVVRSPPVHAWFTDTRRRTNVRFFSRRRQARGQ